MTEEAQRIAIAKAVGWRWHGDAAWAQHWKDPYWSNEETSYNTLPDYLADLNAMHEAEKTLTKSSQWMQYNAELFKSAATINLSSGVNRPESIWLTISATASQRAEAFLKTIGKWTGQ